MSSKKLRDENVGKWGRVAKCPARLHGSWCLCVCEELNSGRPVRITARIYDPLVGEKSYVVRRHWWSPTRIKLRLSELVILTADQAPVSPVGRMLARIRAVFFQSGISMQPGD